ncbi:hypothetical protein V8E54_006500 [Elaphomyces granulatus]
MRILSQAAIFILPSLLPSLAAGSGFDCKHIVVDGVKFDLSRLGGVHELYHVETNDEAANKNVKEFYCIFYTCLDSNLARSPLSKSIILDLAFHDLFTCDVSVV